MTRCDRPGPPPSPASDVASRPLAGGLDNSLCNAHSLVRAIEGRIDTITDTRHGGTTVQVFDREGRLTRRTTPEGWVRYEYDALGRLTRTSTDQTDVHSTYDALGRLETVEARKLNGGSLPTPLTTTYTYDAVGNLASTELPDGTIETRHYDTLNRLTLVEHKLVATTLAKFAYTLDANGRRRAIDELNGRRVEYTYDALGRLTQEVIAAPSTTTRTIAYGYDRVGNRVRRSDSGEPNPFLMTLTSIYNANDRLESVRGAQGMMVNTYTYDAAGQTESRTAGGTPISDPAAIYTWDLAGRLASVTTGGQTTTYRYDSDGMRVGSTTSGQVTTSLIDKLQAYDQVLEEYAPGGALAATYVHGLDLLFQDRGGVRSYYHADGLGSVRAITDGSGAVTDRYTYDAFGRVLSRTGETANDYQFAGERYDATLRQTYLRARYYDAAAGRFTSRDSFEGRISSPITRNHYLYANANPVSFTDPSGHEGLASTLGALGVQGLFNGIRLGVAGAVSGAGFGAIDAALGGQDIIQGAIGGAKWGGGLGFSIGLLGPFATTFLAPAAITALLNMGAGASLALGAYGGASSFVDGNYLQGIYRIGLGTFGYYSFRSAATAPLKPVDIGGTGETPNVINLQPRSALGSSFFRVSDGKSLAGMIREGNQFLIYNAKTGVLPFKTGTVPKVITNNVPIDTPPGGFFPPIKSTEISRVLKPGAQWIRDGVVFYTKPG